MKISYIIIAVIIIVLAVAGYLFFSRSKSEGGGPAGSSGQISEKPVSPLDPTNAPKGEKITIGGSRGSVEVNNFYKIAQVINGDAIILRSSPEYQIAYTNAEGSAFGIYITGGSVDAVRKSAEGELLLILGISQEEACSLNISWAVSPAADKNLAGSSYPLSFCTPGVQ